MLKKLSLFTLLTLTALNAAAEDTQHWMVRGRILDLAPANTGGGTSIGGKPHASATLAPEVDVSYFATPNLAVELIAATTKHKVEVNKKSPTTNLGHVWVLPPTLTAQYHVTGMGNFKPYAGAGVTYAHFYNAEHPGLASVKYKDKFGLALQAGADYRLGNSNFYLNGDVKKIYVSTNATVNDTITSKANLYPWVVGAGIGYRF